MALVWFSKAMLINSELTRTLKTTVIYNVIVCFKGYWYMVRVVHEGDIQAQTIVILSLPGHVTATH